MSDADYERMMRREREKYCPGMSSSPAWIAWAGSIAGRLNRAGHDIERLCELRGAAFLARLAPLLADIDPASDQAEPLFSEINWRDPEWPWADQ